jgi:cell division protein FtsB
MQGASSQLMAQNETGPQSTSSRAPAHRTGWSLDRLPLTNVQIISIALVIVGGRLFIDFSQRVIEGQQMLAEQKRLEAEIDRLLVEQQMLQSDKAYYNSAAYVETWAHDQGKMVRPQETLIVPVYDSSPTTNINPTSQIAPQAVVPKWYYWWVLFFDSPPSSVGGVFSP